MTGRISPAQAKRVDEIHAVAESLRLMGNIVMAWNTSQMQAALDRWSNRRQVIPPGIDRHAGQVLPSWPNAPITGTNGSARSRADALKMRGPRRTDLTHVAARTLSATFLVRHQVGDTKSSVTVPFRLSRLSNTSK